MSYSHRFKSEPLYFTYWREHQLYCTLQPLRYPCEALHSPHVERHLIGTKGTTLALKLRSEAIIKHVISKIEASKTLSF